MRSLAEQYHRAHAADRRASDVAEGSARPTERATLFDIPPDTDEAAGYLPGPVPWRLFDYATVLAATTHPDAAVRKRAARQLHRLDARAARRKR